jgi:hypothetical protein
MEEVPRTTEEEAGRRASKRVYEVSTHGRKDQINEGKNIIWTPNYY